MLYLRKTQELAVRNLAARFLAGTRSYSRDYDSSDDEKDTKKKSKSKKEQPLKAKTQESQQPTDESASTKLNRLLASMQADEPMNFNKHSDVVVPRPGEANKKKKLQVKQQAESKDIFTAARRVASMLGEENKQQTESELLSKLLGGKPNAAGSSSEKSKSDSSPPESEISLSELIVGMKIDRRQPQKQSTPSRSEYVRRSIAAKGNQNQQYRRDSSRERNPMQRKREAATYTGSVNLFGGQPLGIFTDPTQLKDSIDLLPTWSYLQQQSLKLQVSHPPSNYFDKMALWTEQGKVWRFPIDNEQDWVDEKNVDFSEHIFLEQHLEGWCPNRGPIRHFMELVCVGLSKNPFISAKEKNDHILWYRDYFETKKDILKDLIVDETKSKVTADKDIKQVEA